jgi:hypothetical protein
MTKQIGIILPHLGLSQLSFYACNRANALLDKSNDLDIVFFIENLVPPSLNVNTSIMNLHELVDFKGVLITTSLSNTQMALKCVNKSKILYYVWDLEWLRGKTNYIQNLEILRDSNIELIARSLSHFNAIEKYCNRKPIKIIQDVDILEMINGY